jgi:hypothetical protein
LELNSSCVNGKVVNSVKGNKRDQNDLQDDAFFHVDETLIMDEDDFKAYPAG